MANDVQRYGPCDGTCLPDGCDETHFVPRDDGPYVLASDHAEALAEAVQRQRDDDNRALWDDRQYDMGWNAALAAVQARVVNLPVVGRLAGTDSALAALDVLAAIQRLRKTPPQPEPVPHWPCECGPVCSEPAPPQPEPADLRKGGPR